MLPTRSDVPLLLNGLTLTTTVMLPPPVGAIIAVLGSLHDHHMVQWCGRHAV